MPASSDRPYYDHDAIWADRARAGNPVWGGYSHRVYAGLVTLLQKHRPPPARILDVGCGAGAFGRVLREAGYDYAGVDASGVAVELGAKHYPELTLHCGDFARPEPPLVGGAPFDVVTAVNALHCLVTPAERAAFLANLARHAAPSGLLVLTTMCAPVLPEKRASQRPRLYAAVADLERELATAGFTTILHAELAAATPDAPISNWTVVAKGVSHHR